MDIFDLANMIDNPRILIIGAERSGKTTFIKTIINNIVATRAYLIAPSEINHKNLSNIDIFKDSINYNYNHNTLKIFRDTVCDDIVYDYSKLTDHNYLITIDDFQHICNPINKHNLMSQLDHTHKDRISLIVATSDLSSMDMSFINTFDYIFLGWNTDYNITNDIQNLVNSLHININHNFLVVYCKNAMETPWQFVVIDNHKNINYDVSGNYKLNDLSGNHFINDKEHYIYRINNKIINDETIDDEFLVIENEDIVDISDRIYNI